MLPVMITIHTQTEEKGKRVHKGSDTSLDCRASVKKEERMWKQGLSLSMLREGKMRTM